MWLRHDGHPRKNPHRIYCSVTWVEPKIYQQILLNDIHNKNIFLLFLKKIILLLTCSLLHQLVFVSSQIRGNATLASVTNSAVCIFVHVLMRMKKRKPTLANNWQQCRPQFVMLRTAHPTDWFSHSIVLLGIQCHYHWKPRECI